MKKIMMGVLGMLMAFSVCGCTNDSTPLPAPDTSQFPLYVEPNDAKYEFGFSQMVTPYFKGNVIYNETVLLTKEKGNISGKLQYAPVKILSVRDYTWKKEYASSEYSVSGNVITPTENSTLPYLLAENFVGVNIPEPYREVDALTNLETDWMKMAGTIYTESPLLYGNQISVSYVYDVADVNTKEFARYTASGFPKLKAKLNAGENVKMVITGDSIAEGCSSSKKYNHEPFMDNWFDQIMQGLNEKYGGNVVAENLAVGGKTSEWGAESTQTAAIVAEKPDMLMVHFGVNDAGAGFSADKYYEYIEKIINDVQGRLPECEIMLIKAFPPISVSYDYSVMEAYWKKLDALAKENKGVYTFDMFTPGITMLKTKKYMDVTANGINHLNDFSSRLYSMNILSALIEY